MCSQFKRAQPAKWLDYKNMHWFPESVCVCVCVWGGGHLNATSKSITSLESCFMLCYLKWGVWSCRPLTCLLRLKPASFLMEPQFIGPCSPNSLLSKSNRGYGDTANHYWVPLNGETHLRLFIVTFYIYTFLFCFTVSESGVPECECATTKVLTCSSWSKVWVLYHVYCETYRSYKLKFSRYYITLWIILETKTEGFGRTVSTHAKKIQWTMHTRHTHTHTDTHTRCVEGPLPVWPWCLEENMCTTCLIIKRQTLLHTGHLPSSEHHLLFTKTALTSSRHLLTVSESGTRVAPSCAAVTQPREPPVTCGGSGFWVFWTAPPSVRQSEQKPASLETKWPLIYSLKP